MAQKKFDLVQKLRAFNRPSIFQLILMGVGLILAVVLWIFLSGFVSCWQVDFAAGHAPANLFHQQAPCSRGCHQSWQKRRYRIKRLPGRERSADTIAACLGWGQPGDRADRWAARRRSEPRIVRCAPIQ